MRIAVCDNNAATAAQIGRWIEQYCALYELKLYAVKCFTDPTVFQQTGETFDIAFLGFGGGAGFMAAQQLRARDRRCRIILMDDTQEYAVRGMRIHCTNFLLRPVEFRHIVQSMQLASRGRIT